MSGRATTQREFLLPLAVLLLLGLAGCQTQLMPTPNIYVDSGYELYEPGVASSLGTSEVELLYATDRTPETAPDGSLHYGWGRSRSVAFGTCRVEIGRNVDWETLYADSTSRKRSVKLPLSVKDITELARLPDVPGPLVESDGRLVEDPEYAERRTELAEHFRQEVQRRLAQTPVKRAFVYVHGFNNTFDYAASIMAEFYHFGGRAGVPILYTWPAASPGLLQGYTHDRDSGQFTIYHFKQFIRALASVPELERIEIIAHSRGTFVATAGLRELLIELRGSDPNPQATLKIGNVVLASPDLDFDVLTQRLMAERVFQIYEHLTVYASSKDKALGLSDWLFQSRVRLGQVQPEDLNEVDRALLAKVDKVDIIDARVKTGALGHSYYHSNPAVSSDMLLLLRYGYEAGSPERPLREAIPNYWILEDESYPFVTDE